MLTLDLSQTEETIIKRLLANKTVVGVILTNKNEHIQYTSLDNNITFFITSKLVSFANMARSAVRDIDPTDELLTLRLRTQHKEIMLATTDDGTKGIAIQKINSLLSFSSPRPQSEYEDDDDS